MIALLPSSALSVASRIATGGFVGHFPQERQGGSWPVIAHRTPCALPSFGDALASAARRRGMRTLVYPGIRQLHPKLDLATQPMFA